MKIGSIKIPVDGQLQKCDFEVNSTSFFTGLTFTGLITGLVATLSFWLIDLPKSSNDIDLKTKGLILKRDQFTIQVFDHILRIEDEVMVEKSFMLLINTGLLKSSDPLLNQINSARLPNWSKLPKWSAPLSTPIGTTLSIGK